MKAVGWLEEGEIRWLGDRKPEDDVALFVETPQESMEGRAIIGYTLEPIYETPRGRVVTQAFILCNSCADTISGNGGPRYNAICPRCANHLNFLNLVKGN
jgi:hypothetical protein